MTADDRALVQRKLAAVLEREALPAPAVALMHEGVPQAKQRAGRFRGRSFNPPATARAERDLGYCFRSTVIDRPWLSNVAIVAVFYFPDRRRVDAENCMKTVMDAATKANVWRDDSQVTAQASWIELDAERPRTLIALCRTTSSLDRTVPMKKRGASLPL